MADRNNSPAPRRGVWGWMLFDWAAQPFFTVVTTFIFGPYFVSRMATDPAAGQAAWGYGIAAAGFVIAILSPVLGSIADQTGPRKPWIAFFAVIQIVSLSLLWFAEPGSPLIWPLLFFSLASVAAEFSIVFNNSMMPRLVAKEDIGRISNIAWGLGYLGGMIVLIFVVGFLAGSPRNRQDHARPRSAVRARPGEGRGRARHRAACGALVFRLHPADVPVHAGCRQGQAAGDRRARRARRAQGDAVARRASAPASCAS